MPLAKILPSQADWQETDLPVNRGGWCEASCLSDCEVEEPVKEEVKTNGESQLFYLLV